MWVFLAERIVAFYKGFWQKRVVAAGFLVVNLWWKRGELWLIDGRVLGAKNMPLIRNSFWVIPILGITR
jgi:hypothetical protein